MNEERPIDFYGYDNEEYPCVIDEVNGGEGVDEMNWIAGDFETSNSDINIKEKYTRVWLWDIYDHKKRHHFNGNDIETFFDKLFAYPSTIIYFHNLKFDGSFALNYLLENGFTIDDSHKHMTISTLITDRLVWYTFTVYYCGCKYVFRDSMKKIVGTIANAAKAFNLPIMKGEIDYKLHRDKGYIPTEEELAYIHNDTEIMSDILEYYYDNGMTSITNATDAMKAYKNIIGEHAYRNTFPILSKEIDDFIRASYKGGFCFLNPKFANQDLGTVYTYDVKSMYPSVMAYADLPYGVPQHYKGEYEWDETMPLFIQEVYVDCKLKEGRVPSIQSKSFMSIKLNYLRDTKGLTIRLVLTSLDLINLLEDYEIYDIEYVQGYKFRSSKKLFADYVNYYYEKKESSTGALKQLYKIFLNSLYGKFAMMTERAQAIPTLCEGVNKYDRTELEEVDATYTAVASFITASARFKLLSAIRANLGEFVYCDTDSIHLLKPIERRPELYSLGKRLGDFDLENGYYAEMGLPISYVKRARYLGQKCYVLDMGENLKKKIAGAPDKVKEQIDWDNFHIGFTSDETEYPKFRMENVKGGVLLVPTTFSIKNKE